jgi:octaprenyl-diphosphate synthase
LLKAVERKIEQFIYELNDNNIIMLYKKLPIGKRLRAKLILKIAGESLSAIKLSAVVEMIHLASLLHDDVIDNAYIRRNSPSINALYGNKTAIMLGDILYSKGFYELNNIDSKISKIISNAVMELSLGEQLDVRLANNFNTSKDDYIKMIYKKTASLIEACAYSGAVLANKNPIPYKIYGKNIGIAFQIIDDILDITGDSNTLGKPSMHDFVEGKTTLPYIYLYDKLDDNGKTKLISLHKKELNTQELNWILREFKRYNIIEKCIKESQTLVEEALNLMNKEGNVSLQKIAQDMINRNF